MFTIHFELVSELFRDIEMPEIHFIRMYYLWLFIPLILLLILLFRSSTHTNQWKSVCDPHLLDSLMVNIGKKNHQLIILLTFVVGSLFIFSLAGPSWQKLPQNSYTKKQATVVVLDMSSEMSAMDIKPTRLQRAKFKIQDILKQSHDGQIGLIAFSSESFLVSPLTNDSNTLHSLLNELTPDVMPTDGSNIKDALERASKLIKQSGYEFGNVLIVTANKATENDLQLAKNLSKNQNLHISVLGMATTLGAPIYDAYHQSLQKMSKLDKENLTQLARAGNGIFVAFKNDNSDLNSLLQFFKKDRASYMKNQQKVSNWQDSGRYLILLLLPLVLVYFRRGFIESLHS